MASVLAVTPEPLQHQLQPTIRVAGGSATDAAERLRECYALALALALSDDQLARIASLPLFEVPAAEDLLAALGAAPQKQIRSQVDQLRKRLAPHLPTPLGAIRRDELSCLMETQQGCPPGTVVLVRESDLVTEQYAFPLIRVDPSDASVSLVRVRQQQPQSPATRGIRPMGDGLHTFQEVLGAGMAVTPFLPPPYNVVATGGLALLNLIVGLIAGQQQAKPSILEDLKKSLDASLEADDIRKQQAVLRGVNDHFTNQAESQTAPIDKLTSIDGGVRNLLGDLTSRYVPDAERANDELYSILTTCTTDNFASCLGTLISGITLDLVLKNATVMIEAVEASIAYRHKDMNAYSTAHSSWTAAVLTTDKDIGASRTEPWDDSAIDEGLNSTSYIPKIEAWMAKAKRDRLNKISATYRSQWVESQVLDGAVTHSTHAGWTYKDSHQPGDGGQKANQVEDTPGSGCCSDAVEHKDVADAHRATYLATIAQQIDAGFAPHRRLMATWTIYIDGLKELLPPPAPPAPAQVRPLQGGPPLPQGDWVQGAQVRYAVAAVNKKGPSSISEWSAPITVKTAFATVSGFGPALTADSLTLYRQIRPHGQEAWGPMLAVGVIEAPFPPEKSYDDKDRGGDDW